MGGRASTQRAAGPRRIGWGLALGLALAGPGAAGTPSSPDLDAIAAWVAAELGAPAPKAVPRLAFVPADELHRRRYGAAAAEGPATLDLVALYDDATRTIFLTEGWTGATARESSVLVHEMVHHVQSLAGRRYGCGAEREAEAYALQDRWLVRSGETLETAFQIDALSLMVLTHCPR
jgi:hypothetical protein